MSVRVPRLDPEVNTIEEEEVHEAAADGDDHAPVGDAVEMVNMTGAGAGAGEQPWSDQQGADTDARNMGVAGTVESNEVPV